MTYDEDYCICIYIYMYVYVYIRGFWEIPRKLCKFSRPSTQV